MLEGQEQLGVLALLEGPRLGELGRTLVELLKGQLVLEGLEELGCQIPLETYWPG